jgi:hypothetical protein
MRSVSLLLLCRAWCLAACIHALVAASATCAAEEGFVPLFDGKSFDGWTSARGNPITRGWKVEDEMIVYTGGGGSLYSAKEYGDFELRFEWKLSKRGNSGVKYRVAKYSPGVYADPEWLGYEYQIWDDANRGTPAHMNTASIYLLQAPDEQKPLKPIGEFNESRIVAVGSRIEHWLNGKKVLEVDTDDPMWWDRVAQTKFAPVKDVFRNPKGRIQLQDHGDKVWFRNLRIREIEADKTAVTP